jgi:hypothetical protein
MGRHITLWAGALVVVIAGAAVATQRAWDADGHAIRERALRRACDERAAACERAAAEHAEQEGEARWQLTLCNATRTVKGASSPPAGEASVDLGRAQPVMPLARHGNLGEVTPGGPMAPIAE